MQFKEKSMLHLFANFKLILLVSIVRILKSIQIFSKTKWYHPKIQKIGYNDLLNFFLFQEDPKTIFIFLSWLFITFLSYYSANSFLSGSENLHNDTLMLTTAQMILGSTLAMFSKTEVNTYILFQYCSIRNEMTIYSYPDIPKSQCTHN